MSFPLMHIGSLGLLPYMGCISTCDPKGYGFSAVLAINRVSILVILVINRVWFLHTYLEIGYVFLEKVTFSPLSYPLFSV